MTIPINMTLYRLLVKQGASEQDAEAAASVNASHLATRADISELKTLIENKASSLLMWMITALLAQTALLLTILRLLRP